jgi:hypothetical protein
MTRKRKLTPEEEGEAEEMAVIDVNDLAGVIDFCKLTRGSNEAKN